MVDIPSAAKVWTVAFNALWPSSLAQVGLQRRHEMTRDLCTGQPTQRLGVLDCSGVSGMHGQAVRRLGAA